MKWMILALRLECNMFGLVEMKRTVLPHKKDAEFHDTNHCRKERKAFMTVGSLRFDDYYFCAANDIECIRIQL
jgi:hypothetical protein